jgi:hypothetical protein
MSSKCKDIEERDATIASLRTIIEEDASDHARTLASHSATKAQLEHEVESTAERLKVIQESMQKTILQKEVALQDLEATKKSMETHFQHVRF